MCMQSWSHVSPFPSRLRVDFIVNRNFYSWKTTYSLCVISRRPQKQVVTDT
jgi:hypothetical protein